MNETFGGKINFFRTSAHLRHNDINQIKKQFEKTIKKRKLRKTSKHRKNKKRKTKKRKKI